MNAIPGEVTLLIDIRGKKQAIREQVVNEVKQAIAEITERRLQSYQLDDLGQDQPRSFNQQIAQITEHSCINQDYSYRYMYSGAGHDAMNFAPICPTSMIFIPCKDGISHSPKESVTSEQIAKGIQVLIDTTIELSKLDITLATNES
ncbi:putative N-carbamoyl-beta-alanine amidohydrolase [Staphylococcus gallinarum]|nr:putative N-carbamoyl-beta-alanine amidohydrolase [Staphylococcus gallinarum]